MGTRALVNVWDDGVIVATIYRQFDGYPEGLGAEVAKFVAARRIVNGYGGGDNSSNAANGMGCMAAQLVAHLKGDSIGNVYLYPPGLTDCGEEFIYDVYADRLVASRYGGVTIYDGPASAFDGKAVQSLAYAE